MCTHFLKYLLILTFAIFNSQSARAQIEADPQTKFSQRPAKGPTFPSPAELAKQLETDKKRASPPQKVEVEFSWDYKKGFPLKVRLFELSPSAADAVGFNRNDKEFMSKYPILKELQSTKDGHFLSTFAGKSTTLLMVIENTTDQPVYFYAAPHDTYPAELSLGMKFFCLCNGHAYRALPHHFWTRVVTLRLTPQTRSTYFKLRHEMYLADPKVLKNALENDI